MSQTITPEEVRRQISRLHTRFENARNRAKNADEDGQQILKQIEELQGQCSHEQTEERPVQDVTEMKFHRFCSICGARR